MLEAEKPLGLVRPERIGTLKKINDLIGNQTRNIPACSIAPQPLRYRVWRRITIFNFGEI
jgi:hypothetical protein